MSYVLGCVFSPPTIFRSFFFVSFLLAVGSLTIPLAQMGAKVASSDISAAMTQEAAERAKVGRGVARLSVLCSAESCAW